MFRCKYLSMGLALVPALLSFVACGSDDPAANGGPGANNDGGLGDGSSTPPWGTPPAPVSLAGCDSDAGPAPADKSSGYLLITENRLAKLREEAAANAPRFQKLKANAEQYLTNLNSAKAGPENAALMYLLTSDAKYAESAWAWTQKVRENDIQGGDNGNYLEFGDMVSSIAIVLNWAKAGLSEAQQKELADWLDASCDELWFHPGGSGWAIADDQFPSAGNNFRMAFIEGTVHAGYALHALGDSRGQKWIDLGIQKLEMKGGVFEYLDVRQSGGDWLEGTNYGQRSKQRLFHALAAIASMGGKNYFNEKPFFANAIQFATYQAQPDNKVLYPGGDLARSAVSEISSYDREYMQVATYWLCDSPARRLGQHYLTKVADTYEDSKRSFDYSAAFYLDLLYALDIPALDATTLPLSYRAAGTNWVNGRSGWDTHATSFSLSGAPLVEQSHQHFDPGSFLLYKDGWLLVNPETFNSDGEFWRPDLHQGLFVPKIMPRYGEFPTPGLTKFSERGAALYAQVDNSKLYRFRPDGGDIDKPEMLVNEHTREVVYLRPDTVFVFDRVDAPQSPGYYMNFHFASSPTASGSYYTATNGTSGISFAKLLGGAISVEPDGGEDSSYRIEEAAEGAVTRYLNVMQVASGAAPAINPQLIGEAGKVRGAVWNNAVVVFSDRPRGEMPALPFSYIVPGEGNPTHMLVNMTGSVNVTAVRSGGSTTVTVAAGNGATADADGVIVATP
ncbi:MAG TPA: hypothetical protein VM925_05620 [Labilithrix sp.]|nr:hypothetical protein [Labilithrix sp.]